MLFSLLWRIIIIIIYNLICTFFMFEWLDELFDLEKEDDQFDETLEIEWHVSLLLHLVPCQSILLVL